MDSHNPLAVGARVCAQGLKETLAGLIPAKQEAWKKMKVEHGDKIVDTVTLDQVLGGARSVKCMVWETSLLDAQEVRAARRARGRAACSPAGVARIGVHVLASTPPSSRMPRTPMRAHP